VPEYARSLQVVEAVLFLAAQSQDAHGDERAACQQ
jgi:hypothetical protein